jgi:ribosomal protein S18 acetylase RimI-like enzyme
MPGNLGPEQVATFRRNGWQIWRGILKSVYFEDYYETFTFDKRIIKFKEIAESDLKISIVKDGVKYSGYCISTKNKLCGEIESIYISEDLQGRGIGKKLISDHLNWLKENQCKKIQVAVSYGHESEVQEFYHKLGFYERLVYFELKG